ncbi:Zn(2)-C6 fungal-type domain-containing protein [Fusarium falciforme]|uniref:Zn(2)-C6 fungal-type domain-containing protein n=1 Tax=Fusarium falciforme TaxID=195108 RepID=UPI002301A928|nr:Zn(2)-C6 fungal-type domain-containing protein [Fusarium falciforme]WAO90164.1 Zn(2)-C6 fungal-type domain-containing protein [Fusarium falciforme]
MEDEINVHSPRPTTRQRKKISNACIGCRNRKTRCSGRHPCERCVSRKETCAYEEKERKAAVPVDYLDRLHARIKSLETQLQEARNLPADGSSSHRDDQENRHPSRDSSEDLQGNPERPTSYSDSEGLTNTLVTSEPQIKVHRYGHAAYLGHSSTLSFSRNVRNLLQRSSPIADPGSVSVERQDVSYTTALPSIALDLTSISLPRLSYAEYLTNTVVLHTGSLYSLFEPASFLQRLRDFYDGRAKGVVPDASLWHIQMLLVLAFGKSILSREHSEIGPSGMTYFTRAIQGMPDIRRLYEDPLLSIEILCLASLFMHARDLLQEAYVIIGQALRISVTKVMNKLFPEALRPPNVEYQRRLWWTVYCIDRKSAAMLGSPSIMRDEDISIPFPEIRKGDEAQNTYAIHATLSSHLGKILDVIYGVHDQQQKNFLVEVKTILSRLAETSVVLREHLHLDIQQPGQSVSRDAATLHLLLHQCVILTVRPVLFSLLKPLLSPDGVEGSSRRSSAPLESMLRMCIESAVHILKIMSILKHQMMCDVFLPYDIDALFSAAFALILIDIIRPANELLWDLPQVMSLLDEYVSRHVAPAQAYRSDLLQLLELRAKIRGVEGTHQLHTGDAIDVSPIPDLAGYAIAYPAPTGISPDPVWSRIRHGNDNIAPAHPEAILWAIDDLDVEGTDMLDAAMLEGGWMWELDDLSAGL